MAHRADEDLGECISLPTAKTPAAIRRRRPSDDVVWEHVEHLLEEDTGLTLAPLDAEVERNREHRYAEALEYRVVEEAVTTEPRYQYSLREMLILNTVLAVLFALMRILAPSWVAGTLGITTLAMAVAMAVCQPENRRVEYAWWCMLLIYVGSCAFAIFS